MTVGDAAWAGVGSLKDGGRHRARNLCRIALHVCLWAINLRNWSCEPGLRPVTGGLFRNPTKEAFAGNSAGSRAQGATEANEQRAFIHQGEGRNPTVED